MRIVILISEIVNLVTRIAIPVTENVTPVIRITFLVTKKAISITREAFPFAENVTPFIRITFLAMKKVISLTGEAFLMTKNVFLASRMMFFVPGDVLFMARMTITGQNHFKSLMAIKNSCNHDASPTVLKPKLL